MEVRQAIEELEDSEIDPMIRMLIKTTSAYEESNREFMCELLFEKWKRIQERPWNCKND